MRASELFEHLRAPSVALRYHWIHSIAGLEIYVRHSIYLLSCLYLHDKQYLRSGGFINSNNIPHSNAVIAMAL